MGGSEGWDLQKTACLHASSPTPAADAPFHRLFGFRWELF